MLFLFEKDAGSQCHGEHEEYHPYTRAVDGLFSAHHLAHIDTDKEDRYAAPEYLNVAHKVVNGGYPLHDNTPHDHGDGQPSVNGMATDKFHVGRRPQIKHHNGRNVPESKLIVKPEVPVDRDVAYQIYP